MCSLSNAHKLHQQNTSHLSTTGDEVQAESEVADYGNIQTENIYGIPNEKEKAMVKIKKLAKAKAAKLAGKNKEMKDQF